MSHILLIYAALLFCSFLREILRELFFFDIKVTISETRTEIIRKFVFLTRFERVKSRSNYGFVKNFFLIKPVKGDKY